MRKNWKVCAAVLICCLICFTGAEATGKTKKKNNDSVSSVVLIPKSKKLTTYDLDQYATARTKKGVYKTKLKPKLATAVFPGLPEAEKENRGKTGGGASGKTIMELKAMYPEGKYWNHASDPGAESKRNNIDGWTDIPCPDHSEGTGIFTSDIQTCNVYYGAQCHGYAMKLCNESTGTDPSEWPQIWNATTAMNQVKAGDLVRIRDDGHSFFVTAVRGNEIMYTDCNMDETCSIQWDSVTTKDAVKKIFTYMKQSPVEAVYGGEGACWCKSSKAGIYTTTTDVVLRKGHGNNYDGIVTILAGSVVQAIKGDDYWTHVTCSGYSGIVPTNCLTKGGSETPVLQCQYGRFCDFVPLTRESIEFFTYCGGSLPAHYSIQTSVSGGAADFFRLDHLGWDGYHAKWRITFLKGGATTISFQMKDTETGNIVAADDMKLYALRDRSTLTSTTYAVKLDTCTNPSEQFTLTGGGFIPEAYSYSVWNSKGNCYEIAFPGDYHENGAHDVKITALGPGTGYAVFAVACNDKAQASKKVTIRVTAGHSLTEHRRVDASCTEDGTEAYWECSKCKGIFADANAEMKIDQPVSIPATGHTVTPHATIHATCTENGTEAYWQCTVCRKLFADEGTTKEISAPVVIKAEGHKPESHPRVDATCTENGTEACWQCTVCRKLFADEGTTKEISAPVVIKAEGHKPESHPRVDATCTEDGTEACWQCTVCKKFFADENTSQAIQKPTVITATGHQPVAIPRTEASCAGAGREGCWQCRVCLKLFRDESATQEILYPNEIPATGHTLVFYPGAAATCTENGTEACWVCSACCRYFSDEAAEQSIPQPAVIPAPGHALTAHQRISATCTENGAEAYWDCAVCGKIFADAGATQEIAQPVPIPGGLHTPVFHKKKDATCTENGMEAYWDCAVCGRFFADEACTDEIGEPRVIPAKGHTVVTDPAVPAGPLTLGLSEGKHCSVCGETLVRQELLPAIQGKYKTSDGTVYQINGLEATYVKPGKSAATIKIGDFIKIGGVRVNITGIADKAFYKDKKLQTLVIGKNITRIGKNAFNGCKNLGSITFKTKQLSARGIGANAFKGIRSGATIKCPKSKLADYKEILLKKGMKKSMKFKKGS